MVVTEAAASALVLLPVLVVRLRPMVLFERSAGSSRPMALLHVVRS